MTTPKLSRKQREIREREQLILEKAADILYREGYSALSMERLADAIEYSKGTVYQHFKCKEDVLCALCILSMNVQSDMFIRATQFNGRPREKMVAVLVAHQVFVQLFPREFSNLEVIKHSSMREKLAPASQQDLLQCEALCLDSIARIVHEAQELGDLQLTAMTPTDLIFGLWALSYGGSVLIKSDIPLDEMGISNPEETIGLHTEFLLDAFNWQPLAQDWDYQQTVERIRKELFAEEISQLNNNRGQ